MRVGYMFRSRWGALLFVAMSATGAASLVGGEDEEGVLMTAAEDLERQRVAMERTVAEAATDPSAMPAEGPELEFTDDEELIDDAAGFDPTPVDEGTVPADELVPHDEVVIVPGDVGAAGQ